MASQRCFYEDAEYEGRVLIARLGFFFAAEWGEGCWMWNYAGECVPMNALCRSSSPCCYSCDWMRHLGVFGVALLFQTMHWFRGVHCAFEEVLPAGWMWVMLDMKSCRWMRGFTMLFYVRFNAAFGRLHSPLFSKWCTGFRDSLLAGDGEIGVVLEYMWWVCPQVLG